MANVLTFDLGGTYIKYGLIDTEGHILHKNFMQTPSTLEDLLMFIKSKVLTYTNKEMKGIAVSAPSSVSEDGFIYGSSAIPYIHGPNIKHLIEKETGLATQVENDANCVGLAEVWKGSAKGKKDVCVVVIGTGIGGALIKNGIVHKGNTLHGGEFGYMILNPHNLSSGMNTFSEVASTYSIIKRVASEKQLEISSLTGEKIFTLADQGDKVCERAISEFITMLSIGIYNIQYALDPEIILIGGGISARDDLLLRLRKEIDRVVGMVDVATIVPRVDRCTFHADANMIGAVYHFLQRQKND
ncbi:ROK family protein [Virgibacillus salarius]|uniref:ROK family protein n=1 Tax=Virgibacillus salarius TaxID=447199 RepID=UPI002492B8B4|nr:ROK family protein [Virgibacillus salarius]WBX78800.1 ROK family protein [Virgibacillus salarius]